MARPNMPKYVRTRIYPQMKNLWPEVCSNCQKTIKELGISPFDPSKGTGGLEIHHTRYDVRLDDIRFTRFMCHGCNHKSEFARSELEQYNNELSASMASNLDKHQIFLDWFSDQLGQNNLCMAKKEVIASGAYVSGANVATVKRWIEPLVSKEGPFSTAVIGGVLCVYLKGANIERFPSVAEYQKAFNAKAASLPQHDEKQ